eukprot:4277027-Pleurochrysis_carterae.AAC.1
MKSNGLNAVKIDSSDALLKVLQTITLAQLLFYAQGAIIISSEEWRPVLSRTVFVMRFLVSNKLTIYIRSSEAGATAR